MRRASTLFPVLMLALALAGCPPEVPPGDPVGVYSVSGRLEENTCGRTGLPASDTLEFDVELRADGTEGHWIVGGELPGFDGELDEAGAFLFGVEQVSEVRAAGAGAMTGIEQPEDYYAPDLEPQAQNSQSPCRISIVERIEGTLHRRLDAEGEILLLTEADEMPAGDLEGDNRIELSPMPGSDCRASLAVEGGPFLALPCYARYALSGTLADGE